MSPSSAREHLRSDAHRDAIARRQPIDYAAYGELHERALPVDGGDYPGPKETGGPYRLAALSGHKRIYRQR